MLDGKRFLPETGTPIWKIARISTLFAVCEPEPFAVATWSEKSFTTTSRDPRAPSARSVNTLDIDPPPFRGAGQRRRPHGVPILPRYHSPTEETWTTRSHGRPRRAARCG